MVTNFTYYLEYNQNFSIQLQFFLKYNSLNLYLCEFAQLLLKKWLNNNKIIFSIHLLYLSKHVFDPG